MKTLKAFCILFLLSKAFCSPKFAFANTDKHRHKDLFHFKNLEPIDEDFDETDVNNISLLKKPTFNKLVYDPFFHNIDFTIYYGGVLWDLLQRLNGIDKILSGKLGLGLLIKSGFYITATFGYSYVHSKGIPIYKSLSKYKTYGYHLRAGIGYYFNYSRSSMVGFATRYGISIFKGKILNQMTPKSLIAHYIDVIVDTKSRIITKSNFYLGLLLGVQMLIKCDYFSKIDNYLIPGYGRSINKFSITGGLYLQYSLPLIKELEI